MGPQQIKPYETRSNAGISFSVLVVDTDNAAQDISTWTFQAGGRLQGKLSGIDLPMTASTSGTTGEVIVFATVADVAALFAGNSDRQKSIDYDVLANVPGLPVPALIGYGSVKIARGITEWA